MQLDVNTFSRQICCLYDAWVNLGWPPKSDALSNIICFMVAVGEDNADTACGKSIAFHKWLFGKQLNDTICVFTRFNAYILSGTEEHGFLKPIENYKAKGENEPIVELFVRDPNGENSAIVTELLDTMAVKASSRRGNAIGVFGSYKSHGKFCESWQKSMSAYKFDTIDITAPIEYLMAVKDEYELITIQEASQVSVDILQNYLTEHILEVIDAGNEVKHSELAAGVERALTDKAFVSDVDTTQLAMHYPPIIQSGGNYQLNYSAGSDDNYLQSGTIICSLGVRYKSYCSNIARTLLISSSSDVQQNYNFVLDIERELFKQLIPGAKLNEIYELTMEYVRMEKPHLVDHLMKTFGFSIGIEFDESPLIIGPECTAIGKENMVFNVSIGSNDVTDCEGKLYALLHSDTVIVNKFGPALATTPPPCLKLITDCWTRVFNNLSLEEILAVGQTSKYMNQMAGDYFHDNFPN